ncbi:uncharacterized protein [Apostichopus japonicus]|uniref:uncharacterized protein n=1 Tax=Stichopus japonicus TaxID=307972 RepID=UPI003AB4E764
MAPKITANTSVVVCWMEPARDRGRESTVRAKCVLKPHRSKLSIGVTALVRWRSSGRVYKAVIKAIDGEHEVQQEPMLDAEDDAPISTLLNSRGGEEVNHPPHVQESEVRSSVSPTADTQPPCLRLEETDIADKRLDDVNPAVQFETAKKFNELRSELQSVRKDVQELKSDFKLFQSSITETFQEKLNAMLEAIAEVKHQGDSLQNLITQRVNRKNGSENGTPRRPNRGDCNSPETPTGRSSRRISPFYGTLLGNLVKIPVDSQNAIFVDKDKYEQYFLGSSTATSFVRRLMPHFFSSDEMLQSNYDGGLVVTGVGKVTKLQLDRSKVKAILRQAELEFQGCTQTTEAFGKLRVAINDRCRSEGRRLALL